MPLPTHSTWIVFALVLFHANSGSSSFDARSHSLAEVHVGVAWTFNYHEILECAHLKFTVSGQSKQTNKHYTHLCNAVTLVWDSLRLTPMMCQSVFELTHFIQQFPTSINIFSSSCAGPPSTPLTRISSLKMSNIPMLRTVPDEVILVSAR